MTYAWLDVCKCLTEHTTNTQTGSSWGGWVCICAQKHPRECERWRDVRPLGGVQDLIVEDREVQSKAKSNWMSWREI